MPQTGGFGAGRLDRVRQAEVAEAHAAARVDEHVGRLEVGVYQPAIVRGLESGGGLPQGMETPAERGRLAQPDAERRSLHELHHHRDLIVVRDDVEDRDDVGVGQRRQDACFLLERLVVLDRERACMQPLDRDVAAQAPIEGFIHHPHAAAAESSTDLVATGEHDGLGLEESGCQAVGSGARSRVGEPKRAGRTHDPDTSGLQARLPHASVPHLHTGDAPQPGSFRDHPKKSKGRSGS